MEPYSAILACLVKVVTLTTPTHVATIANEWLPIQTYREYIIYGAISQSVNQNSADPKFLISPILRAHIKNCLNCFIGLGTLHYITLPDFLFFLFLLSV